MECKMNRKDGVPTNFDITIVKDNLTRRVSGPLEQTHNHVSVKGTVNASLQYDGAIIVCKVETGSGNISRREVTLHIYRKIEHNHFPLFLLSSHSIEEDFNLG